MFSMLIRNNDVVQADCPFCKKVILVGIAAPILCPLCFEVLPGIEELAEEPNERLMYHTDGVLFS